jgi:putative hydrolase of the HAD superfamily
MNRVLCRAVFLDAGGVIVLPHRGLVRDALARVGLDIDPSAVGPAHYRAARRIDRDPDCGRAPAGYLRTFCSALGVPAHLLADAVGALSQLADRGQSGEILWSEAAPHSRAAVDGLTRAGIAVLVVTNSDGHAAENLRDAGICQTRTGMGTGTGAGGGGGAGGGARITDVIDSTLVGSAKPDPEIFRVALRRAQLDPTSVVHVGDMACTDVAGARAAGIAPIHLDPERACRARDHRHVRSLAGIWRHVAPAPE